MESLLNRLDINLQKTIVGLIRLVIWILFACRLIKIAIKARKYLLIGWEPCKFSLILLLPLLHGLPVSAFRHMLGVLNASFVLLNRIYSNTPQKTVAP